MFKKKADPLEDKVSKLTKRVDDLERRFNRTTDFEEWKARSGSTSGQFGFGDTNRGKGRQWPAYGDIPDVQARGAR